MEMAVGVSVPPTSSPPVMVKVTIKVRVARVRHTPKGVLWVVWGQFRLATPFEVAWWVLGEWFGLFWEAVVVGIGAIASHINSSTNKNTETFSRQKPCNNA